MKKCCRIKYTWSWLYFHCVRYGFMILIARTEYKKKNFICKNYLQIVELRSGKQLHGHATFEYFDRSFGYF